MGLSNSCSFAATGAPFPSAVAFALRITPLFFFSFLACVSAAPPYQDPSHLRPFPVIEGKDDN
jgi:hypothetical protein